MALVSMSKGCRKVITRPWLPGLSRTAFRAVGSAWVEGQVLRWPHTPSNWPGKPQAIPSRSVPPAPSAERVLVAFIVKDPVHWATVLLLIPTSCLLGLTCLGQQLGCSQGCASCARHRESNQRTLHLLLLPEREQSPYRISRTKLYRPPS